MDSHLNILHILHIIGRILFHEFYKHSFWYVRIDALWKNMVPYNCSPITYIRFCQVTFNNWNMKMITLPNTDCWFSEFRSYYPCQKWCPCNRQRSVVKGQGQWGQNPIKPFAELNSSLNSHITMKWCIRGCFIVFQGHPSNFKVIQHKNRWFCPKIGRLLTVTPVWIHPWPLSDALSLK